MKTTPLLAPALALILGCGAELPPPRFQHASPQHAQVIPEFSTEETLSPAITVPRGWLTDDTHRDIFKGMTTVFVAQSPRPVGHRRITVTINMRPWSAGPELFAAGIVRALEAENWPITRSKPIYINTVPAARVDAVRKGSIINQVNVAVSGVAYLVLCTGSQEKTVHTTCNSILTSLELVPTPSSPETP
jgi:hypothetical protein